MPSLPPSACAACGRASVSSSRYCAAHQPAPDAPDDQRRSPWAAWYCRRPWTGPHGLRAKVLARDPVCRECDRNPSAVADHVAPHRGNWALFTDLANLRGVCKQCHDRKTAAQDGGFGNPKPADSAPTVSAVGRAALDRALAEGA